MSGLYQINAADRKSSQSPQKVCRLCLSEESLENIFTQNNLSTWISNLLSIVVSHSDKISHWICVLCRIRLQEFRDYQSRCLEVQEVLLRESAVAETESTFSRDIQKDEISIDDSFGVDSPLHDENEEEKEDDDDDIYNISLKSPQEAQLVCLNTPDNPEILRAARIKPASKRGYKGRHIMCNICGKAVQKLRFDNHMNGHLGTEIRGQIDQWGEVDHYGTEFYIHFKLTNGLRPYKCERGCKEEYFACKYKRQFHYRKVHEGFLHECGICDRSFGTRQGLFSHKQRNHTTSSRKCTICDQIFSSESLWKKHSIIHQASASASSLSTDSTVTYKSLYKNFGKTDSDR